MKKSIIYLVLIVLFSSCLSVEETVYDRIPEENFPENEAQASLLTVPVYKELADLCDDAGWWLWAQEVPSDEIVFPTRLTDWDDGGKWRVLHQHAWDNNTDAVNSMWSHMYDGVVEANKVIDGLLPNEDEESVKVILAKLKTLRAFYYYLLMDNYGDVPFVTSFFTAEAEPEKTPRAEIYNALVTDLKESLPYLPGSSLNFAVSKGMAYTLLAKLYLNAEVYAGAPQWELAEAYCDSVIDLGIYQLESHPLNPFVTDNESSIENIFTIPFDEDNQHGLRIHMRTLHYLNNRTYDMVAGPWNGFAVTEQHYNTYEDDDVRKKEGFLIGQQYSSAGEALFDETADAPLVINPHIPAVVMDGSYSFEEIRMSGARVIKFEIKKGADENLSNDFPIFRYADILLMKAEAVIRQGGNGDEYVNEIRRRAEVSEWSGTTLEQLLEERGREMFMEGHRRQDLIRFGKYNDSWWEKSATGPEKNVFPIPQWAIDANPNLAN
jgi:hypothetical protein